MSVAILGLDALASAAYGPEALLTVLLVLGAVGLNYVLLLSGVIVPELVEHHPFHYLLHNQRATLLKAVLLFRNDRRIVVVNVPWYLDDEASQLITRYCNAPKVN